MKKLTMATIGVVSGLYLLNPGFGIFELIPDAVPFVGNLDEGTATFFLLSALAYFGIDVRDVFGGWGKRK
ncbi:MAG: DUF1232 domain-containing protein [Candidatus Shapirobacteria bacterium]